MFRCIDYSGAQTDRLAIPISRSAFAAWRAVEIEHHS